MQDSGEKITFSKRDLRFVCKNTSLLTYYNISTSEPRVRLVRRETSLSPPVKYFTDLFKAVLLLWIIYIISVLFLLCVRFVSVCLSMPCAGKGLASWPLFVMYNCEVVTFP